MITDFEREGMNHSTFPMDKDEGIAACKEYCAKLEAAGISTQLVHFAGGLFTVKGVDVNGNLYDLNV